MGIVRTSFLARLDAIATRSLIGLVAEAHLAEEAMQAMDYAGASRALLRTSLHGLALCAAGAMAKAIGEP